MSAYLQFFELEQSPFEGKTGTQVVLGTKALREALEKIRDGLDEGVARICVSGGPGLGKTSLARALPKLLDEDTCVAVVLDPSRVWESQRGSLAKQWDLEKGGLPRSGLLEAARNKRLVVVVDQAETASEEFLDHLDVLLSYRSEEDEPVVQSVLLARLGPAEDGQPPPLIWWLDRIQTLQLEFAPLPRDGVDPYIRKHLKRAGWKGETLFTPDAALAIHGYTGGIPGDVSGLCEQLLAEAASSDLREIDAPFVHAFCDAGEFEEETPRITEDDVCSEARPDVHDAAEEKEEGSFDAPDTPEEDETYDAPDDSEEATSFQSSGDPDEAEPFQLSDGADEAEPFQLSDGADEAEPFQLSDSPDEAEPFQLSDGPDDAEPFQLSDNDDDGEPFQLGDDADERMHFDSEETAEDEEGFALQDEAVPEDETTSDTPADESFDELVLAEEFEQASASQDPSDEPPTIDLVETVPDAEQPPSLSDALEHFPGADAPEDNDHTSNLEAASDANDLGHFDDAEQYDAGEVDRDDDEEEEETQQTEADFTVEGGSDEFEDYLSAPVSMDELRSIRGTLVARHARAIAAAAALALVGGLAIVWLSGGEAPPAPEMDETKEITQRATRERDSSGPAPDLADESGRLARLRGPVPSATSSPKALEPIPSGPPATDLLEPMPEEPSPLEEKVEEALVEEQPMPEARSESQIASETDAPDAEEDDGPSEEDFVDMRPAAMRPDAGDDSAPDDGRL